MDKEIILNIDGSHNGYDYVDLGLPSGTKWATCNIGADKPEYSGLLFQFGRTDGYVYGDTNIISEENNLEQKLFYNIKEPGFECTRLKFKYDVAHIKWGGRWRIPNKYNLEELLNNTNKTIIYKNDIYKIGILFTSKINNKSILIPFGGYYNYHDEKYSMNGIYSGLWSSELNSSSNNTGWFLYINDYKECGLYYSSFFNGFYIRPIFN